MCLIADDAQAKRASSPFDFRNWDSPDHMNHPGGHQGDREPESDGSVDRECREPAQNCGVCPLAIHIFEDGSALTGCHRLR